MWIPSQYAIKLKGTLDFYYRRGPMPHWVENIEEATTFQCMEDVIKETTTNLDLYEVEIEGFVDVKALAREQAWKLQNELGDTNRVGR